MSAINIINWPLSEEIYLFDVLEAVYKRPHIKVAVKDNVLAFNQMLEPDENLRAMFEELTPDVGPECVSFGVRAVLAESIAGRVMARWNR